MGKGSRLAFILGILAVIAALAAAATAVFLYFDKKRDDEELEQYLDCSIQ